MSDRPVQRAYGECPHPDRPVRALGQCASCYGADLRVRNPAIAAKHKETHARWMANPENRARHHAQRREARARRGPITHRKYQLTREEYEALMAQPCGICGGRSERMHMDHDHSCCPSAKRTCGKCVRGALCHRCNLGLGYYEGWFSEHGEKAVAWIANGGNVKNGE